MKLHLVVFLLWETINVATISRAASTHPTIVLIAFDGVLQHYLQQESQPADLRELLKVSTTTEYLLHQLPSRTLPNLHSIATGLYPDMHGILGDRTFDQTNHQCIGYGSRMYTQQTNVTPIWTLNEMSGDGRHSGVITWPGAEFGYLHKPGPTFRLNITECISWESRVDHALRWLTDEMTPANLILLHFEANQSRTAETVPAIVQRIDKILKYYFERLNHKGLRDKVNTIIVSDHASPKASVDATPQCDGASSPTPNSNCETQILENLRQASTMLNAFKALQYAKLKNNYKTSEISQPAEHYLDEQQDKIFVHPTKFLEAQGQDHNTSGLFPLFIANGPLFEPNFVAPPFENIDIYALISHTLNLTSPVTPINGSLQWIQHVLKVGNQPVHDKILVKVVLFSIVGLLLLVCAWYILKVRKQDRLRL